MAAPVPQTQLLLSAFLAVVGLILLIAKWRWHAFLALTAASLVVGLTSGMELGKVAQAFQEGVGAMLGSIAIVVGLGMILGKLLERSGGAQVVANTLIQLLGPSRLPWTMMIVGFVVGIPVFFTVGVVLLVPILNTLVKETSQPLLLLGAPLLAGLSVAHGLLPPHPGAMAALSITKADAGKTILYGVVIGLPAAILAGPLFARLIAARLPVGATAKAEALSQVPRPKSPPGFALALLTILLPVGLMLLATVADLALPEAAPARGWLDLLGSPVVALLLATLFALYSFGVARGFDRTELLKLAEESLGPAGSILLVVGAGGGFNRVLVASGIGETLAAAARHAQLSPLLLGWLVAALIRVATGSATVAITTAAGLVTPFALSAPGTNMELLVIAMGAGSLVLSHVNDGGFWFVREYLGLTVMQTLQSWTVLETIISLAALGLTLLLNAILG